MVVPVEIQRVGPDHRLKISRRIADALEPEGTADRRDVSEQGGRPGSTGRIEVDSVVVVAIEGGDPATDEEVGLPVVRVDHTGARRFLDELRRAQRDQGCRRCPGRPDNGAAGEDDRNDSQCAEHEPGTALGDPGAAGCRQDRLASPCFLRHDATPTKPLQHKHHKPRPHP